VSSPSRGTDGALPLQDPPMPVVSQTHPQRKPALQGLSASWWQSPPAATPARLRAKILSSWASLVISRFYLLAVGFGAAASLPHFGPQAPDLSPCLGEACTTRRYIFWAIFQILVNFLKKCNGEQHWHLSLRCFAMSSKCHQ